MENCQTQPSISVVIPVYDEAGNIQPLVDEVRRALQGRLRYELILVDDGSKDTTAEEIRSAAQQDPGVVAMQHASNRGQSAAVHTGVEVARAEIVAVLDGDGQNDPQDIPKLFGHLVTIKRLKMVIGERRHRQDGWVRRVSSRIANGVRARLLADGINDTGCGIKVFYRDDFLALPAFDHMHRFLPALMQRGGGQVGAVAVNHRPRRHGQSKYGIGNRLWVGIADLLGVMWLQKRRL